jgi:pimeloyl-ACP methyl ester carboxylesterase
MDHHPENMQRLFVGAAEIEYSERGQGEPIVLVHAGVFADWFVPLSASPTLDDFRVIRVRRPGYGPTLPTGHVTIADHARFVAALVDHLSLEKIHCVGHSSGCQIVLQLAIDRPDRVQSLALLEPAPAGALRVPASEVLGRFIGPALEAFSAGDLETAFDRFLRGVGGDDHRAVIEGRLGRDGYERAIRDSGFFFADEIRAVQEWQFGSAEGDRIRQPALIVEGGEQPAYLRLMSRQLTELALGLLPNAEAAIIPGTNHLMPLQAPDAVGGVIAAFVRRHALTPAIMA